MISYRIGFSECEHRRASNGQHARKRLFNEFFPACQALIRGTAASGYFGEFRARNRPIQAPRTA